MAIGSTRKFFAENAALIGTAHGSDTVAYNLNAGLMNLVEELDKELTQLRAEIAALSRQVAGLKR